MNLTLSVDDHLFEEVQKVAAPMGKSVDQLIQGYLKQLTSTASREQAIAEFRRLSEESQGNSRGWKFDRDEIHARP